MSVCFKCMQAPICHPTKSDLAFRQPLKWQESTFLLPLFNRQMHVLPTFVTSDVFNLLTKRQIFVRQSCVDES